METTPNDLRQQQFEIKFRGYNPDDVEVFRELAANALEEARGKVLQLTEENNHLRARLKHLIEIEDTLKAAVLETQKNSEMTIATAKKQADATIAAANKEKDLIIREAQHLRDEVIADMHRRMGKLVNDINKIRFIRNNYLTQLKHLVAAHNEMIERAMAEDGEEEQSGAKVPRPPEYEPAQPAPMTPPEASEIPDTQIHRPQPDTIPVEGPERTSPDMPSEPEIPQAAQPPAGEPESDDEWQNLTKQLSEDN